MPSFTPLGYKLMDVPKDLHAKLHKSLHDGMNTDEETEEGGVTQVREIYVNGRPNAEDPSGRPTFVHNGGLMVRRTTHVLNVLPTAKATFGSLAAAALRAHAACTS